MISSQMLPPGYLPRKVLMICMLFLLLGPLFACNKGIAPEQLLFPDIKPWDLQSLKITDKNNNTLVFTRKMCVWTLGQEGLAADEVRVTGLADQIMAISYRQKIPANKVGSVKYKADLDSFNYRVDLGLPAGATKTLFIGADNASKVTHVRIAGAENIYVLSSKKPINNIVMERDYWLSISDN